MLKRDRIAERKKDRWRLEGTNMEEKEREMNCIEKKTERRTENKELTDKQQERKRDSE